MLHNESSLKNNKNLEEKNFKCKFCLKLIIPKVALDVYDNMTENLYKHYGVFIF